MSQELIGSRYRILGSIGRGGFSEVFLAFDEKLRRRVAVKRLNLFALGRTDRERFLREARMLANLRHRHILTIYSLEEKSDYLYIVMEYADRGSLHDMINDSLHGLQIDDIIDISKSMCKALSVVHNAKIIHRDVKPHNILLITEQGEERPVPKLADFGLARDTTRTPLTPADQSPVGTLAYMPPRAIQGKEGEKDERRDVYALGATLYEALTKHLPLGDKLEEILRSLNRPPNSPRRYRSDIPAWLEEVVLKALASDPDHRYSTMRQMLAALEQNGQEQPAKTPFTQSRFWNVCEQTVANVLGNAIWWIVGGAIALILTSANVIQSSSILSKTGTPIPTNVATASPPVSPTRVSTSTPAVLLSRTPMPTTASFPTTNPTPLPTTPNAPTPPPTATPPSTPTPTQTPTPTSSPTPPSVVPTAAAPELVAPAQGQTYRNPINFQWRGTLGWGQAFRVIARHTESGGEVKSEMGTDQSWTTSLPEENYGEWRWTVSMVRGETTLATSPEWMFWFNPYPGSGEHRPRPTHTPPP